jgi:hypothetical protein
MRRLLQRQTNEDVVYPSAEDTHPEARGTLDRLVYVCSSELDHRKLICDDAGPGYAQSLGVRWGFVTNVLEAEVASAAVLLICNRLRPSELARVVEFKRTRPKLALIAKLVDPRASSFHSREQLWDLSQFPHTAFLSVYEPKEAVREFLQDVDENRWAVVPYPYLPWREVGGPLVDRKGKAVLTGSMDAAVYPLRTGVRDLRANDRAIRRQLDLLKHPGYADLGARLSHRRIGAAFIEYLSEYQMMFLCGTRADVELMKYLECAYAGCAPFGTASSSFAPDLADLVLKVSPDYLKGDLAKVLETEVGELQRRASRYREIMRETRSRATVRAALTQLISSAFTDSPR